MPKSMKNIITKDFIEKEYIQNKKSLRQITRELNCQNSFLSKYVKKYGFTIRKRHKEMTGKRFGKLTIIKKYPINDRDNTTQWICKCDCGKEKIISAHALRTHRTVSCGCYNKEKCWKGYGDISGGYFNSIKKNAQKRKLEFELDIEFLWDLYLKQDRKCALTGDYIFFNRKGIHQSASIDRIDSSKGYLKNNVRFVHKTINTMKWDMSDEEFLKFCTLIVDHYDENI